MHFENHESILHTILVLKPVFNEILVENHRNLVPIFFPVFCNQNLKKTKMHEKKQETRFLYIGCVFLSDI